MVEVVDEPQVSMRFTRLYVTYSSIRFTYFVLFVKFLRNTIYLKIKTIPCGSLKYVCSFSLQPFNNKLNIFVHYDVFNKQILRADRTMHLYIFPNHTVRDIELKMIYSYYKCILAEV